METASKHFSTFWIKLTWLNLHLTYSIYFQTLFGNSTYLRSNVSVVHVMTVGLKIRVADIAFESIAFMKKKHNVSQKSSNETLKTMNNLRTFCNKSCRQKQQNKFHFEHFFINFLYIWVTKLMLYCFQVCLLSSTLQKQLNDWSSINKLHQI